MANERGGVMPTDQELAAMAGEGNEKLLNALREEREARQAAERRVRFVELSAANPKLGLTNEDFEGLNPDKWEARVARLAALQGQAVEVPKPPLELEQKPDVVTDGLKRLSEPVEAQVLTPQNQNRLTPQEAWALKKRNPAEFERARADGRVDLPKGEDRGGSIIYHSGV